MERKLILSQIQTPDGAILKSMHQHDYKSHVDVNGETYILDGGNSYQRFAITKEPFKDLSIYSDAPYEVLRTAIYRGGYGKDGNQPLKWVPLDEMSNEWLENCITYEGEDNDNSFYYKKELEYRKENDIFIKA